MKVIILGAGVIGTTTAHYLAQQGADVTVIDRQAGPALETSYANAGQVSPGYSTPWAAPGIPLKALKWMFDPHAPLALRPDGSLYQLRWMWQMLRNCSPERYAVNKERMMRVAEYSRDCLMSLRADLHLPYEHRTGGTLQLFRTEEQMDGAQRDMEVLRECGVPFQLLDASGVVHHEPGLAHAAGRLTGGLRLPNDETGDCRMFTRGLAEVNERLGVKTLYGKTVQRILTSSGAGRQIQGVVIDGQPLTADRYVLAFGSFSRQTARDIGLDLPVYPVKGYSLTVPLVDEAMAPRSTVLDETYKIAVTRFDQRIRVGGMAELAGYDMRLNPKRRKTLEMVTTQLFPGGDLSRAEFWTGLRPMTPDGTPILGQTPIRNLYLNTGHGTLGWTMACGSGRIVADLVMGRRPDINVDGLDLSRYAPIDSGVPRGRVAAAGRTQIQMRQTQS